MNHMEEVAKMLGVRLGEKFRITGGTFGMLKFYLAYNGMWDERDSKMMDTLSYILIGKYTIEKLPWKPGNGDIYWYVNMNGYPEHDNWDGYYGDYAMYYAGNCFRTKEEAEAHATEIIEKLKTFYDNH